uniref:Retrovirus-related Pol polyprotein from transposon TNT 1-94 n=1 Tax=Tanacetum cinerariifolium TaxID=118510 RepID=A0A699HDW3_TANCI|nr:retrovirus-related Pol polyprotein from transposon TNT 1-94 [Tanacetum cinerariifolium]
MANMSEDIQYAGFDTRPPMLDRTDYESWQQLIRLYYLGKDNGENIMKLIVEGNLNYTMTLNTSARTKEKTSTLIMLGTKLQFKTEELLYRMFVVDTLRIIKEDNFKGIIQEDLLELGMQEDKMLLMQAHENGAVLDEEQLLFLTGEQVTNFDDDVDDPPEQDLALNVDHVFKSNQCDAFDSDVDEAPTTQTMFVVNLSFEDPIYDESGPSYDTGIPYEVQDHDNCSDGVYEYHDEHEMQNNVQQDYVADFDADYTSDSNIILYNQYVEDNAEQVVQKYIQRITEILQDDQAHVEINCAYQGDELIVETICWKSFGEYVGQLVIRLDKILFNRTHFYVLLYEMVADSDVFCS